MDSIESLIDALISCVPGLDDKPLRENPPEDADHDSVFGWLCDHLEEQGLMVYEEWKEYFGDVPELRSLEGIDFSAFDSGFVYGLVDEIDWSQANYPFMADDMPFLEYINFFLVEHGLRLVNLLPFENAYIFCVRDDDEQLDQLDQCLEVFGMNIEIRNPLDQEQAREYMRDMLGLDDDVSAEDKAEQKDRFDQWGRQMMSQLAQHMKASGMNVEIPDPLDKEQVKGFLEDIFGLRVDPFDQAQVKKYIKDMYGIDDSAK